MYYRDLNKTKKNKTEKLFFCHVLTKLGIKMSYVDVVSRHLMRSPIDLTYISNHRGEKGEKGEKSSPSETVEIVLEHPSQQPFFPRVCDVTNSVPRYRFSNTSIYSSGCVEQSIFTAALISSYFDYDDISSLIVTDATSCIGGNTWAFAKCFKRVNAVEINELHVDMLRHNMKELCLEKKINVYHQNYLDVSGILQQDVVFIDPPWGGVRYRSSPQVGLMDHDDEFVDLDVLLANIELDPSTLVIVLKVPKNYSTYGLKREDFPYKRVVSLRTRHTKTGGRDTLYKLVFFSKQREKRRLIVPTFSRTGYKSIRYASLVSHANQN